MSSPSNQSPSRNVRIDPVAVVGAIFSVVSVYMFPFALGVIGIILGVVSRSRISGSAGTLTGKGIALAAVVIGVLSIIWYIIGLVALGYTWRGMVDGTT